MSRFYASISGQAKTQATRRGGVKSGIQGHVRGWNVGIEVTGYDVEGVDNFRVTLTGGSHDSCMKKLIGTFTADDLKAGN